MKLYYPDSRVATRQNFFSDRVVQLWNGGGRTISATCVSAFKSRLNSMHVSFSTSCFSVVFVQLSISG